MDVLISFYIDGDLSNALKKQVEDFMAKLIQTTITKEENYETIYRKNE